MFLSLKKNKTDAAALFVGSQVTYILRFFLSRNIRIVGERAWAYTVTSRGKGPEFWQPYVEEWEVPPVVDQGPPKDRFIVKMMKGPLGLSAARRTLLFFLNASRFGDAQGHGFVTSYSHSISSLPFRRDYCRSVV